MRHRVVRAVVSLSALLAAVPALSGCGSAGGTALVGGQFVQTLDSDPSREGSVFNLGAVLLGTVKTGDTGVAAGVISTGGEGAFVGDVQPLGSNPSNQFQRGFVSFTRALPPGATLVSATLELSPITFFGTPDLATLMTTMGNVVADHVDLGAALDATDFAAAALQSDIGTVLTSVTFGAVFLDVTASVLNDIANARPRSEFRVRFQNLSDNDSGQDSAEFGNSASPAVFAPHLTLTFTLPGFDGIPYDHNIPN
jgi:hypothetical protein